MALAMAPLTLIALDPFAHERGLAASCQTFLQSGFNGIAAGLIAPCCGAAPELAWGMAGFAACGAIATLLHARRAQQRG